MTRAIGAAVLMAAIAAAPAVAQTPTTTTPSPATHDKGLEISFGGSFLLPVPMGSRDITLQAPNGGVLTVAQTKSRTASSAGLGARLAFNLSRAILLEVGGGLDFVRFQTSVSGDIDGAAAITSSTTVRRLTAGGAGVFNVKDTGKRTVFVIGGASWMREINELSATGVYEDGAIVEGGAGVKMWFGPPRKGRVKRVGLRLEGRVGVRTGGLTLDTKSSHMISTIFGGLVIGS